MRNLLFVIVTLTWATALGAAGVAPGMTRAEVENELGRPSSVMERGERLILNYPDGGRVVLVNGRATEAVRVAIAGEHAPSGPAAATPVPEGTAEGAAQTVSDAEAAATAREEAEAIKAQQRFQKELEDVTEKLANGEQLGDYTGGDDAFSAGGFWSVLAVSAVFQFFVTAVVLKLAFKWADVHADWGQMWIPALVDMVVRTGVEAGAYVFWEAEELFRVEQGLAYFALLFTLMKTTHACTWSRAVAVAGAAKLGSLVVWALLSVFLLRLLFT